MLSHGHQPTSPNAQTHRDRHRTRHRVIVEADGPFHSPEEDAVRDAWLRGQSFRVLRFTNSQINAPDQVLGAILAAIEAPPVEI